MIRYITLSVYSMIITRVFIKLREKLLKYRYPEAQDKFIKSIGVDPVEYMYAVKCARVSDDNSKSYKTIDKYNKMSYICNSIVQEIGK